jgi:peptide/nickel transport system permease protein
MFLLILQRVLATIPVVAVVAVVVFLMLRLTPGDPAAVLAGDNASLEQIERIRIDLGLDRPIYEQFAQWIGQLARADLGTSIFTQMPVTTLIGQRLEPTLMLALTTVTLSVLIAVPLGVLAAWKAGTWTDRIIMVIAVVTFSFPVFVLGYLLIYQFGISLRWLPTQGYRSIFEDFWGFVRHMTLPTVALSSIYIALITRITRASVLETLNEDYIRTARAKGLSPLRVIAVHALRNALIPVVTVIGLQVGVLFTGAILTETIFSWPGVGKWLIEAIFRRDYPVLQGGTLLLGVVVMSVNLLVDLAYGLINPRIRHNR